MEDESQYVYHYEIVTNETVHEVFEGFFLTSQFIMGLCLCPIFSFVGLFTNCLCIFILRRIRPKLSIHVFLMGLAVSDILKNVCGILYFLCLFTERLDTEMSDVIFRSVYSFGHYTFYASSCVTAWMIVAIGFEGYSAVFQASRFPGVGSISRATKITIAVFVVLLSATIPYALRFRSEPYYDEGTDSIYYELELHEIWSNFSFSSTYTWLIFCVYSLIPSAFLSILSISSIIGLFQRRDDRSSFKIAKMVLAIIGIYAAFTLPDTTMAIVFGNNPHQATFLERGIREVTELLTLANASVKFFIYFAMNESFRNSLKLSLGRNVEITGRRHSEMVLLSRN